MWDRIFSSVSCSHFCRFISLVLVNAVIEYLSYLNIDDIVQCVCSGFDSQISKSAFCVVSSQDLKTGSQVNWRY